jgi:hypothetical protein
MCVREVGERVAPDREHGVGGGEGVAQRHRLLGVQPLGLVAVLGLAEVEVARDAQQLVGGQRGAGAVGAARDIGLDAAEVPPAVEDHGHRLAQGKAADPHCDRGRCAGLQECPTKEFVGVVHVQQVSAHYPTDSMFMGPESAGRGSA